ncbi:hypothetical protein HMPREF3193_01190 [Bifidobacterium breve]|uniref:Uncharacterized protein n=1 Tax=Bifidobacterium longum subsp. infantis TaxID=1682 RepID=A0A0M4LGK4_BIFLI|nr:Hypothetical protein RY67_884 [Bifidobacterium longum subsp. infantis]ERI88179.1 hypothetical protein HMPREF1587_00185 [Bifidobacterium breve JCP7499]KWZ85014.1 hypothetical protein HMPREF3193_01190 [Bifidobacterium breve]
MGHRPAIASGAYFRHMRQKRPRHSATSRKRPAISALLDMLDTRCLKQALRKIQTGAVRRRGKYD